MTPLRPSPQNSWLAVPSPSLEPWPSPSPSRSPSSSPSASQRPAPSPLLDFAPQVRGKQCRRRLHFNNQDEKELQSTQKPKEKLPRGEIPIGEFVRERKRHKIPNCEHKAATVPEFQRLVQPHHKVQLDALDKPLQTFIKHSHRMAVLACKHFTQIFVDANANKTCTSPKKHPQDICSSPETCPCSSFLFHGKWHSKSILKFLVDSYGWFLLDDVLEPNSLKFREFYRFTPECVNFCHVDLHHTNGAEFEASQAKLTGRKTYPQLSQEALEIFHTVVFLRDAFFPSLYK